MKLWGVSANQGSETLYQTGSSYIFLTTLINNYDPITVDIILLALQ